MKNRMTTNDIEKIQILLCCKNGEKLLGVTSEEQNAFINGAKLEDSLPRQDEEVIVLCDKLNVSPVYEIYFAHIVNKDTCKDFNGWNIPGAKYWFPMPTIQK